jgi:2-polyprenyl-3-methyl-5-hydroxy-6-metoxy-1,4-benzoquinol methylase
MTNRQVTLRLGVLPFVLTLLSYQPAPLQAQAEHPVTGRPIAPVMGVSGAEWLERAQRDLEEMPEAALDAIGIQKGMTVADVGAGVGYFSLRIAKRVGSTGKVYANDVQPEMLTMLKQRAMKAKVTNVVPVLGTESDPQLPAKSMDVILLVDVYHELSQPQLMLQKLRQALKDDGRLVLLEFRKEDPRIPIRSDHKMSVEEVLAEVTPEGFRLEKLLKDLPRQHIFIFRKNVM